MRQFQHLFGVRGVTRVLDVGGDPFNWSLLSERPRLTIVNLYSPGDRSEADWVVGDGRKLPFKDQAFDVVYSNSVIEHLGAFADQQTFAGEIVRVGCKYYVQTPNRWFPVEPHYITPLIHFLPKSWQKRLLRNFTLFGIIARPTHQECEQMVDEICLLDIRTMKQLFPEAAIIRERFLFFTKSLIAIGGGRHG